MALEPDNNTQTQVVEKTIKNDDSVQNTGLRVQSNNTQIPTIIETNDENVDCQTLNAVKILHPHLEPHAVQVHFPSNLDECMIDDKKYNQQASLAERHKRRLKRSTIKNWKESAIEIVKPNYKEEFYKYLEKIKIEKPAPKPKPKKKPCCASCSPSAIKKSRFTNLMYYKNNMSFWILILIYVLLSILFVLIQLLVLYPNTPWYVQMARAAGILIDFNSCLVILLVLRRLTSWARNTLLGARISALDDFINFHKVIGIWIGITSLIHTVGQIINMYYISTQYDNAPANATYEEQDRGTPAQVIFGTASRVGWVGYGASPTGWILVVVLAIMITFAMPFVRRNGYFQLFYVTHWLYYVYFIVLVFHATHFWKWFIGPFLLVLIERIINRFRVWSVDFGETYIRDVNLLSSKVTHLVINRPKGFKYQAGDYMFIKIPKIARNEWHPFTISSAPELKDELWVHVRSLGNWTNELNEYFTNYDLAINEWLKNLQGEVTSDSIKLGNIQKINSQSQRTKSNYVVNTSFKAGEDSSKRPAINANLTIHNKIRNANIDIRLDGPYGTASRRIFDSEHAVLIAGGIGVTPFASILQSLWFQYLNSRQTCENCNHSWYEDMGANRTLKRVDFFWVNRDFEAFEWFVELLGEIELQQSKMQDKDPFIRIHLYMTSAKVEQEIKVVDKKKVDRVMSLGKKNLAKEIIDVKNKDFCLKLIPGRPPLEKIFKSLQRAKMGKVDTYFCGAPIFGAQIREKCVEYQFNFSQENF